MLAECADSDGDENLHRRDGSLLRKKQKQWAKERATACESWFPFGSPGGGAPNRSYQESPQSSEKLENRPSSRRSNVDSGRWSGSENVAPSKEGSEATVRRSVSHTPCPCAIASTSAVTQPSVLVPQSPQVVLEVPTTPCMPRVLSPSSSFSPLNSTGSIPMQFVFSPNPFAQAVPVPVELIQSQPQAAGYATRSVFPCATPVRVLPTIGSPGVSDGSRAEIPIQASSYTEHWANQLPLWGMSSVRGDELPKMSPSETHCVGLSAVPGAQPLAVVHPMMIPFVPSSHSGEQQFSPAQPSGPDDLARKSMSESLTSLNSSSRRSADGENKSRTKPNEIFNFNDVNSDQIAAKRQAEAQRIEEERREAVIIDRDRRLSEEKERERAIDEQKKKARADKERADLQAQVIASLEKAAKEAEMMRKARIYRHILSGSDQRPDLERTILGSDHKENTRVLKEIDSLERQKTFEMEQVSGSASQAHGVAKKGATAKNDAVRSRRSSQSGSFRDDQAVRPTAQSINSYYSTSSPQFEDEQGEVGMFSRRGRQSVRLPSTRKSRVARRASVEPTPSSDSQTEDESLQQRRLLHCEIPVRLQKRIPPPSNRPRGSSIGERPSSFESSPKVISKSVSVDVTPDRCFVSGFNGGAAAAGDVSEKLTGIVPPCTIKLADKELQNGHRSLVDSQIPFDSKGAVNGKCGAERQCAVPPIPSKRRVSVDVLALISDIPSVEAPAFLRKSSKGSNSDERAQNPLFQPVATRCRRNRAPMGNTDIPHPSSSSGSASPPSVLTEDESTPPPSQTVLINAPVENGTKKLPEIERPSAVTAVGGEVPVSGNGVPMKSPFKKILAESMSPQRHRDDELLSPEIRRKGEFPNSTRMRTSTANLITEDSDDGRASPVSPLIQRFNCKTSQYRSFNLKKTNEQNRKVLENLAQMRMRLKEGQEHIEKVLTASGGPPLVRSRTSGSVATTANKQRLLASP